jgi:hypothetical protein
VTTRDLIGAVGIAIGVSAVTAFIWMLHGMAPSGSPIASDHWELIAVSAAAILGVPLGYKLGDAVADCFELEH